MVPEGIVFKPENVYRKLRKKLIENGLIGVVSLPAGVFKPYSGVKTSILIFDKKLESQRDEIFFGLVENDGFSLGDKREPISQNDLPKVLEQIRLFESGENHKLFSISRQSILDDRDVSLSASRYMTNNSHQSIYETVDLGSLISLEYGKPMKKENRTGEGFPVFGSNGIVGFHSEYLVEGPCIIVGRKGSAGAVTYSNENAFPIDTTFFVKLKTDLVSLKYIYYTLKKLPLETLNVQSGVPGLNRNDAYDLKVPLPPLEIQNELVKEMDKYKAEILSKKNEIEQLEDKIILGVNKIWGE